MNCNQVGNKLATRLINTDINGVLKVEIFVGNLESNLAFTAPTKKIVQIKFLMNISTFIVPVL